MADRLGARKAMGVQMVGIALMLGAFAAGKTWWPSMGFLIGWTIAYNVCVYGFNVASLSFYTSLSNPAIGATQFACYMAATNLCYAYAAPLGGHLADSYGFVALFTVAAGLQLLMIGLLPWCDPARAEARFRAKEGAGAVFD